MLRRPGDRAGQRAEILTAPWGRHSLLQWGKGGSEAKSSAGPEAPGRPAAALLESLLSFAPYPRL